MLQLTKRLAVVAALVIPVLGIGLLKGQQEDKPTFTAESRLVVLHASVIDKNGKLIPNLTRDSFKVFENNVPQEIKTFKREDVPVSIGIIIDNSGSMRDKRQKVEAASLALVKASNPNDEVFIVNFNDEAYLDVPFTNDIKKMQEGLTRIDSRGGTAMRDAINMSLDELRGKGKKDKKVLIVVTDGNDNTSVVSIERLLERLHRADGVLVYAIGLLNDEERREAGKAKRALNALTTASGGLAYYPKELNEVETIALDVAHEIRNQYIITYRPELQALDGSFRTIKVTVNAPNKPVVRTRSGYYASADPNPKSVPPPSKAPGKKVSQKIP
jgi:Ca-activated chloride channel homolog